MPSLNLGTSASGVTFDAALYVLNPDRIELNFRASAEQKLIGGLPVNVGVSVSGSVITVIGAQSGPAYSGPLTITVRVTDPLGLLFAELEFPIQFTREEQPDTSGGLGCVDVELTPLRNTAPECQAFFGGGIKYHGEFTNDCDRPVYVKYEWSRFGNDSPRPHLRSEWPYRFGKFGNAFSTLCIAEARLSSGPAPTTAISATIIYAATF